MFRFILAPTANALVYTRHSNITWVTRAGFASYKTVEYITTQGFACDVMAAMLVDRNNKIFLLWELTPFLCKLCEIIFFCFVHQHGGNANHLLTREDEHRPLLKGTFSIGDEDVNKNVRKQ